MKKEILYIHHAGELGGAPKSLSILLNGLDRKTYNATVFMLIDGPAKRLFDNGYNDVIVSEKRLFAFHGTTVSSMSFRLFVKNILYVIPNAIAAYKIISKTKPDIVHLNTTCLFIYAFISKVFFKDIKVVSHVREPLLNNFFGNILKRFNNKYCDFFIPINDFESLPFKNSKHQVVKNSIDTNLYSYNEQIRNIERKELGFNDEDFVIGYFARFNIENGIEDILKIAQALYGLKASVKIIIYGFEPELLPKEIVGIANKMPENVILKGMVSNVNDKMQMIDLLLSPFKEPHFSRSIIEAQSLSIPVLVSNVESQNTLLLNNKTGYLYDFGNVEYAVDKILYLKSNQDVLNQMKKDARTYALDMFCENNNNKKIHEIYDGLLALSK
ncbi:glycosyltransferase family 4 protein [Algibacter miyuki]|uniref:Glycosyltransferase family 4 protein n=1 Tax=Algibacter miyuki TaxID=1306933 RepID=A0ABV5GVD7_9FLAO|nr:glycosyltransferase family 4 protein [Algibacter miyuki]MDN3664921.1 glycosyltransferase family 4 protein [Algibacter miyuki]